MGCPFKDCQWIRIWYDRFILRSGTTALMLKKDLQNPDFISLAAYTYYKQFTGNEMEVKLIAIYAKCQDLLNSALIIYLSLIHI